MITDLASFKSSIESDASPPTDLSPELKSMWYAGKGDWEASHNIAQDIPSKTGSWIHAHLHLVEGDTWNAGYWYTKAGKPARTAEEIPAEWEQIVTALL